MWVPVLIITLRVIYEILKSQKETQREKTPTRSPVFTTKKCLAIIGEAESNLATYPLFGEDAPENLAEDIARFYQQLNKEINYDQAFYFLLIRKIALHTVLFQSLFKSYGWVVIQKLFVNIYKYYDQRALRKIEDWAPLEHERDIVDQFYHLIQFLYAKYPQPKYFVNFWYRDLAEDRYFEDTTLFKKAYLHPEVLVEFYFYLANGGSFRKWDGWAVNWSKGAATFAPKVPKYFYLTDFYWFCHFCAMGGDGSLYPVGCRIPVVATDFWMQWWQKVADCDFTDANKVLVEETTHLLGWVKFGIGPFASMAGEQHGGNLPDFSLHKRTIRSTYNYLFRHVNVNYQLPGGMREVYTISGEEGALYQIVRLNSWEALREEGKLLGHCVGSYEYHMECLNRISSIWSLRQLRGDLEVRLVTIELIEGSLESVCGAGNADPTKEQWKMVQDWVKNIQSKTSTTETKQLSYAELSN